MKVKNCNYCGHKIEFNDTICPNYGGESSTIREDNSDKIIIYEHALKQIAEGCESPDIIAKRAIGYIF